MMFIESQLATILPSLYQKATLNRSRSWIQSTIAVRPDCDSRFFRFTIDRHKQFETSWEPRQDHD